MFSSQRINFLFHANFPRKSYKSLNSKSRFVSTGVNAVVPVYTKNKSQTQNQKHLKHFWPSESRKPAFQLPTWVTMKISSDPMNDKVPHSVFKSEIYPITAASVQNHVKWGGISKVSQSLEYQRMVIFLPLRAACAVPASSSSMAGIQYSSFGHLASLEHHPWLLCDGPKIVKAVSLLALIKLTGGLIKI